MTVGASDSTLTQILCGVKVGDQVVIATITQHDSIVDHRDRPQPHGGGGFGGGFGGGGGGVGRTGG